MTDTFTFRAATAPVGTKKFRVRRAQFGDGYDQVIADGINNVTQEWPLTFAGLTKTEAQAIASFLDSHAGATSFYWTPPLGSQGLYRASEYTVTPVSGDIYTIAVTFTQAFNA